MAGPLRQIIEADLTWTGETFEAGVQVAVDDAGRIERVGALGLAPTRRLTGRALLPGMVNAHSHAFQRGLRGRGEIFPAGAGDFWSWREAMYALVQSLDPDAAYTLSRRAFDEMLRAGVTTVGEFHYIRHDASGAGYALDEAVVRAAADTGVRLVLLHTYYNTGAVGKPLAGGQLRFRVASPAEYWQRADALAKLGKDLVGAMGERRDMDLEAYKQSVHQRGAAALALLEP